MHQAVTTAVSTKAPSATSTVVDSKTTTIGGNLDMSQLEELIRVATQYGSEVKLVSGTLTIKQR